MVTILLQKILDLLKAKLGLINTTPETASGATVVFDTDKELPLDVLKATITASQESGTPTPEDPKAITGYDSVVITQKDGTDTTVKEITVALGNTYYGGVLDCKNGTATITHARVDLGSLNWSYRSDNKLFLSDTITSIKPVDNTVVCNALCEIYVANSRDNIWNTLSIENSFAININSRVLIRDTRYTDAPNFKTAMDGVQLVYELATPITLSGLTPANITTINGTNKLSANCGNLEVGYRISNEMAAANKDISADITVNTTDFSGVSYKVIRAGNVVMISLYSATVVNSYPEALFSGLPKSYNNANIMFLDTVSGDVVQGVMSATGYLSASNAQADQRISAIITYITKDEV